MCKEMVSQLLRFISSDSLTLYAGQFKFQPEPHSIDPSQYQMDTSSNGDMQNAAYVSGEAPSLSSLGLIEDMLSTPDQMDWVSYIPQAL